MLIRGSHSDHQNCDAGGFRIYLRESYSVDSEKGNAKLNPQLSEERIYIESNGND